MLKVSTKIIKIQNVFYSNKLNCLYEHIDLSKEELTSVIKKLHKETYSESDSLIKHSDGNLEKSGKEEDVKFNGYKLFISFLTYSFLIKSKYSLLFLDLILRLNLT